MTRSVRHKRRLIEIILLWRTINYGIYVACTTIVLPAVEDTGIPIISNRNTVSADYIYILSNKLGGKSMCKELTSIGAVVD